MRMLHVAVIDLSLHALGYDNLLSSWSGEEWFVRSILAPSNPKVCIDVGANVGQYTKLLVENTGAHIYAMEPSASSFTELKKQAGDRVTPLHMACADRDGEAILHSRADCDEKASLDGLVNKGARKERVSVTKLSSFLHMQGLGSVDFVKIDTEGFEKEVLQGLHPIRPRFVQFEFNIHHLYRSVTMLDLANELSEYDLYRLVPHGWLPIDPKKYIDSLYRFSNIIAVRRV